MPPFEREHVIAKDDGCDLGEQASSVQINLIHGFRISVPSRERDTHGLSLPVGSAFGSSLLAQGKDSSRPRVRHSLTVFTFVHFLSSWTSTLERKVWVPSVSSRASDNDCRTPS